ncbi:hypothetical protein BDV25DRAFT_159697 [Aspergillus avenaceus]|uniref:Gag1-like clamp domain-containing protein n=1 Tax=Aspergillus avenaceus TaxID=36643 RepID=A0A5N6TNS7_ASPAV|nr:hypothetical protein BDV25DRAFT_159697 [Aspergillus avenaceus]
MTTEARDTAIREAKLYVREIVRNDWVFHPSADNGAPASATPPLPEQDVTGWRLRAFDSSGSELEPMSPIEEVEVEELGNGDGERRRKRRRQMEEEMRWNEGLRTWVERRDVWTGARSREEIVARRRRLAEERSGNGSEGEEGLVNRTDASLAIAAAETEEDEEEATVEPSSVHMEEDQKESTETGITEPETAQRKLSTASGVASTPAPAPATVAATATASSRAHQGPEDPLVPVVPSLISGSNPIRASITPAMYPSIYSKIVIQGLTPTVPINLADVTKAMVQGWKSDGQWPPKPAVSNVVLQDDATIPKSPEAQASGEAGSPESRRRSGVASAVRKVLHFSGFHPHPFHRRSSHSQQGHEQEGQGDVGQSER